MIDRPSNPKLKSVKILMEHANNNTSKENLPFFIVSQSKFLTHGEILHPKLSNISSDFQINSTGYFT